MPLVHSASENALHKNMATLMRDIGRSPHVQSRKQAVAIALDTQRRARAWGGRTPGVGPQAASGGVNMARQPNMRPVLGLRGAERQLHVGPILSAVPGRTDRHRAMVPAGSYVVPAWAVSGRGEGNTIAGTNALMKFFRMGPYGTQLPKIKHGAGAPKPPKSMGIARLAEGGGITGTADYDPSDLVPVDLSGGELVVPPENLREAVHPDVDTAHRILDSWLVQERKKLSNQIAKLPGPAKD